jgi:hypothetical protein
MKQRMETNNQTTKNGYCEVNTVIVDEIINACISFFHAKTMKQVLIYHYKSKDSLKTIGSWHLTYLFLLLTAYVCRLILDDQHV